MNADRDRIRAYYAQGLEEGRLAADDGWFELERTVQIVRRTVPEGARVLDLGGGPGRLTEALARLGYRTTLVDLSPEHVARARERLAAAGLSAEALVGDALHLRDLGPFDAVLSFGPLYHLGGAAELDPMVAAHVALLRPDGLLIAQFLPRTAGVSGLIARAASTPHQVPPGALREAWETGRFANTDTRGFCEAWFAEPHEIVAAFDRAGLTAIRVLSLRGLTAPYGAALRKLRDLEPALYQELLEIVDASAEQPDVIAMGGHAVAIGRLP